MDFTITDDQKALRDAVRGVLGRRATPAAEEGRSAQPPPHDASVWNALVEVGVPALPWSEDDGGVGSGIADLSVAVTETGRARVATPLAEVVTAGVMLLRCAPDDRRRELLGALSEGEALLVPALAEPMRAWGPVPTDMRATESGDAWTLTGTKAPVRYAPAATHLLVTAATDAGTGLFLLEGPDCSSEQVDLDATPAELLAQGPAADAAVREALAVGGALLCAEALGAMEEALRMTTDYLKTREQFGRPLAAFQTLTQRAADMYAQVELARSSALHAAMVADELVRGDAASEGSAGGAGAGGEVSADVDDILRARIVVDKAARHVGREAIQMHGGIGVTAEYPVGHLVARLNDITRTWGDSRHHVRELASRVGEHRSVQVLG